MAYKNSKINNKFFQEIHDPDKKDKLRDTIMGLMKERMKARETRCFLSGEKANLRKKLLENTKLNEQLDYRIDSLMRNYLK
jgi:hypothetical protein